MPSFKLKPQKKIRFDKKTAITLDSKHREIVNDLEKDISERIPDIKNEIYELTAKMKKSTSFEQKLDIEEVISEKKKTIKSLKQRKNDYLLDNSKLIFEYFETKKNISDVNVISKNQALNTFFKIKKDDDNSITNQRKSHNIVQTYLSKLDDNFLDVSAFVCQTDICRYCNKGEMLPLEDEGVLICGECSRNVPYLIENEKPSYKEAPKEICFYAYKRINHFKEIIAQFQGKETTQIPVSVIESIKSQVKKERIELSTITNEKTKDILKKLGYNKYYEHIPFIKDKLGIKPPIMSPDLEDTLCNLFAELQAPYSKYCPDDRVNFLNYYYTAYKLCELLGEDSYLSFFPMLKDREKRIEQDTIWKNICEELDWEFIPTI
jgi:hypothetical protein|uniref:Viral late gene transcription factor 3 zinc ribbon domain-containing protein n=1 Tax=viral metagenome TaxID=1070528 RepID=A0A6C0E5K3_9ZZZZ